MAIKSSTFGRTELSGKDAVRFIQHMNEDKPSEWLMKIVKTKQTDIDFINFDLERMTKAVDAKSHAVPNTLNNFDEFDAWLNQL